MYSVNLSKNGYRFLAQSPKYLDNWTALSLTFNVLISIYNLEWFKAEHCVMLNITVACIVVNCIWTHDFIIR